MKILLVLAVVSDFFLLVRAAASCAECGGKPCMLDGSGTTVTGGATSLIVKFCNFDSTQASTYDLNFGVSSPQSCDVDNKTIPQLASLVAIEGCTPESCAVTVSFKSALDWAIALQNNKVSNTLTAQLKAGGSSETVTIATFMPTVAAEMKSGTTSVSVCAAELNVSGLRFSSVANCNVAKVCRGATTDTVCTTELMNGAHVSDVSCSGEACTGKVALDQSLPCDGSTGPASSLIVGITVASSTQSNYVSIGSMTAPNFTIADATGLDPKSSELVLTTDTFCAVSGIQLNVTVGTDDVDSEVVEVSDFNSTTNGTVVVKLAHPLSSGLSGETIQLALSQCGVSTAGSFLIGSDSDTSTSQASDLMGKSQENVAAGSRSSVSTQEADADSGLSGGIIVAIIIASVAIAGFVFEYVYHTKRQPKPLADDSSAT